jgi:hypothetical protein
MSFERVGPGPERPGDQVSDAPAADPGTASLSRAERLQILSTEHWSLLASRSLAWNESFSRAGMFLSTLSGGMVALALVAQASTFGTEFFLFALVILPIVLFVGVTTFVRLGTSNYHDALCVVGMNRIRGAYLEVAPELQRYFVMSAHDDVQGVGVTMGVPPGGGNLPHLLGGTGSLIVVLDSLLVAVIAVLLSLQVGAGIPMALASGGIAFAVSMGLHIAFGYRSMKRGQAGLHPLFPSDDGG